MVREEVVFAVAPEFTFRMDEVFARFPEYADVFPHLDHNEDHHMYAMFLAEARVNATRPNATKAELEACEPLSLVTHTVMAMLGRTCVAASTVTRDEIAELVGPLFSGAVEGHLERAHNEWKRALSQLTPENRAFIRSRVAYDDFLWGLCQLESRSFGEVRPDFASASLIPVGDVFNHANHPNLYWEYNAEVNRWEYRAARDIDVGEPLEISYGAGKDSLELFSTYGFVTRYNPADAITIGFPRTKYRLYARWNGFEEHWAHDAPADHPVRPFANDSVAFWEFVLGRCQAIDAEAAPAKVTPGFLHQLTVEKAALSRIQLTSLGVEWRSLARACSAAAATMIAGGGNLAWLPPSKFADNLWSAKEEGDAPPRTLTHDEVDTMLRHVDGLVTLLADAREQSFSPYSLIQSFLNLLHEFINRIVKLGEFAVEDS
jgi:hypothetical protein